MVTIQEFVATTKDQAAVEATAAAKQQWTLAANTALALDGAAVKVIDKLTVHWGIDRAAVTDIKVDDRSLTVKSHPDLVVVRGSVRVCGHQFEF